MSRLKKTLSIFLLFILTGLFQSCNNTNSSKASDYSFMYVNLIEFYPYLTKVSEVDILKFVKKDIERSGYMLKGFSTYGDQLPRTWATEKESTLTVYLTNPEDKTVTFKCRPYNPPGQPPQAGDIFINGTPLTTIEFKEKAEYQFDIPAKLLVYGSNLISFKWKYLRSPIDFSAVKDTRTFATGFSHLEMSGKSKRNKNVTRQDNTRQNKKSHDKIHLISNDKMPGIYIPQGGIVEYFVSLPEKSQLGFSVSSPQKHLRNSLFHLAIYSEKGQSIRQIKNEWFQSQKEYRLDLEPFGGQTVKIVFANSIHNHPHFSVSLRSPAIYISSPVSTASVPLPAAGEISNRRPNVFIYLIDTLRAGHLSCYGYSRQTSPHIDAFSTTGILFENCFAAASWTKPAVGSILTGLYPNKHRAEDKKDRLSSDVMMLAEVLKAKGYGTIHITPNVNTSKEVNFNQGVDFYTFSRGGSHIDNFYHSSEYLNSEFKEILAHNPSLKDKPLFAFLHTVDPHDPYTPKKPFLKFKRNDLEKGREKLGIPDYIRLRKNNQGLSVDDIDYIKSLYDCEIFHNDYYFGRFIHILKENKLYENSIIILVSDHGEQFDEHHSLFHGSSIYNEEIHVPLIIRFPGAEQANSRIHTYISQVDIFPTILDYLGIEVPARVDGVSLFKSMKQPEIRRSLFIKQELNRSKDDKSNFIGIINCSSKNKHIISYEDQYFIHASDIEQYNLQEDFFERINLFRQATIFQFNSAKFVADYFLKQMETHRFTEEKKLDLKKLDSKKLEQLKTLGYIK